MKKKIALLVMILIIMTGCNLPIAQSTQQSSVDSVGTKVAETMAAIPSATLTETQGSQPNNQLPTVGLNTLEPTATVTVTPTATTSPDDPKQTLGSPDFRWTKDSSSDPFGVKGDPYEDDAVVIAYDNGLKFTSQAISLGNRWRYGRNHASAYYLEGTFNITSCSNMDQYGLALQGSSWGGWPKFLFGISCNGQYMLKENNGANKFDTLISWTPDSNIHAGSGSTNRIGVMVQNNTFRFYINGKFVREFAYENSTSPNYSGAFINAQDSSNFTFILQELDEWDL